MRKNRKKLIVIGIIIVVLMAVFYVLNNKFGITKYAEELKIDKDTDKLIAVATVDSEDEVKEKYFNENFLLYETNGEELYFIVPIQKNVTMNIYSAVMEEADIVKDKLIASTNKPFILKCNVSDIIPNIIIEIKQNNIVYEYSPSISLKDGSLYVNEHVMDISYKKEVVN